MEVQIFIQAYAGDLTEEDEIVWSDDTDYLI
jgi:hypothetical protein